MIIKPPILIIALLLSFQIFGQDDIQITKSENKICIDTLTTKNLMGSWFDFSPKFYVEQQNWIIYYVNKPSQLKDSADHKGIISFNADGTFEKTYKTSEITFKSYKGTWIIPKGTRQLKLTASENGNTQTWTILELNKDILILKFGK